MIFFIRYDQIDDKIYLTHCCRIESKAYSLKELEERGLQSLIEETSSLEQVVRSGSEKLCKKLVSMIYSLNQYLFKL